MTTPCSHGMIKNDDIQLDGCVPGDEVRKVCKHGSLPQDCEICDLAERLDKAEKERDEARAECDRLRELLAAIEVADLADIAERLDVVKKERDELREKNDCLRMVIAATRKRESARILRDRLGWELLTEDEKRSNLERNLKELEIDRLLKGVK